ncbi:MAG: hypothetical protein ACFBQW_00710 [Sphingomonadaceae bacterium]
MYSEAEIDAAVAAGALKPEAAAGLRSFVAQRRETPTVDEEHFRLLTGFNDIFVAIATVILLVAVGWIGQAVGPTADLGAPSPFTGLFVAAAAWGLAEFFTRKRRMALPSIILLLAFVCGVFFAALGLAALIIPEAYIGPDETPVIALAGSASALAAMIGAWLHWKRFMVPITIAAGAAAAVAVILGLVGAAVGDLPALGDIMLALAFIAGLAVFAFAMWWDGSDPARVTRRSDVAFWLHLLAAPLIVHPIFKTLGTLDGEVSALEGGLVIIVYLLMGLAALAIDRRALLVSALAYVLFAIRQLFIEAGAVELSFALTALVIGSALLLLSAFWHDSRRSVVARLPGTLRAKLPVIDRTMSPQPAS